MEIAARIFEISGAAVMLGGSLLVIVLLAARAPGDRLRRFYRGLRQALGGVILLGLELLVAADILRTVAQEPTLERVSVLGLIVLIRTFLSFTLEVELEGRWPWQRDRT